MQVFRPELTLRDEDVMKLATSRYALKILKAEQEIAAMIEATQKDLEAAQKAFSTLVEKTSKEKYVEIAKKVVESLSLLRICKVKTNVTQNYHEGESDKDSRVTISVCLDWGDDSEYGDGSLRHTLHRPLSGVEKKLKARKEELQKKVEELQKTLLEVKARKSNFPLVSDMARAAVIERQLKNLAPELLERLDAISESDNLRLPTMPKMLPHRK